MNETWVTVVGNIATEVISRRTPSGSTVVSFSVAKSERRRDPETGEWSDGDRLYARVSCWNALGMNVIATLHKGDPVVVHGRLATRDFEVEGQRRSSTDVRALSVGPDLARSRAEVRRVKASEVLLAGQPLDAATGPVDVSHLAVDPRDVESGDPTPAATWLGPDQDRPFDDDAVAGPPWLRGETDEHVEDDASDARLAG